MENKLKLDNEQSETLANKPENGMGYQIVDITLKNSALLKERTVLNTTHLILNQGENIKAADIINIELSKQKNA